MNINLLIEKANKFDCDISEFEKAIKWQQNIKEIYCQDPVHKKYMSKLFELEKVIDKAEEIWIKDHHTELNFDIQFEDSGYAFVEVLSVSDKNGTLITQMWFYGAGEAQEFVDCVCG